VPPAALFPSIALIAGAAAAIHVDGSCRFVLWVLPAITITATLAWYRDLRRPTLVLIVASFAACGVALGAHARDDALHTALRTIVGDTRAPILTRVLLAEDASTGDDTTTLRGRVLSVQMAGAWAPADGGVVLSVGGSAVAPSATQWRRGRVIEAPVTYRRPARFLDEGVADFERDAALDGVSLLGSIKSALLVDVIRRGHAASELAADVRAFVRRAVERRVAPHSELSAAIVAAVLIGDRSGLPDEVRIRLQAAGTYHVIAISGGNIAILAALILVALVPIGVSGRLAAFATLLLLLAYALIVTAGPSVWRATLVAVIYLVARLLDHRSAPWQAMAVAGGLLAVVAPLDVRNAGFVLTFGATAALLHVVRRGFVGPRGLGWLVASITTSAAVEVALLPVMAETFSRVTAAGLVLNLIAIPAMAVVQIAGIVVVCASGSDLIGGAAGWISHVGAAAIVESARLVDVAPWLVIRVPAPPLAVVCGYYASLAIALWARRMVFRVAGWTCVAIAAVLIVTGVRANRDVAGLRLTMFDVGQGDAMALQSARHHTLMIDSGGSPFGNAGFDIGARVVEPALWARGLSSLDTVLLTHGDPDHIGGAATVVEDFHPRTLWQGIPVPRATGLAAVLARARTAGTAVEERREGEQLAFGSARIVVLHPPLPEWERPRVRNDDSVVLEVLYGDVALLLTGDIGADVERAIVPHLIPAQTRILKVAHHGSRTSTSRELLEAWRPQIALISCGRGNPFGHPAPEVIQRLEATGARIYRTDLDGEITVNTDGRSVFVKTFTGEKK
jgi:competence protein ComEC